MNLIIYIALAIPFVGFLTRHLLVSREQFNEAVRTRNPTPTNRVLIANGAIFILIAIFLITFLVRKLTDWPVIAAVVLVFAEGIWDLWHGIRLKSKVEKEVGTG